MPTGHQHSYIPDLADLQLLEPRYEFLRELGRGGMAAVHLARLRSTGELVAVKAICRRYATDAESLARFTREARLLSTLEHANVVRTLAVETVGDRTIAIVMQYLQGRTLREVLRAGRQCSVEQCIGVLRDVGSALRHAHGVGVVHRDVKPENIFLDETLGVARLADFGIARPVEDDVELTLSGMALGTPAYMSPEQIDGAPLDGRSDLYSLGVVAWEMLSGHRPWEGESLYAMLYRQKHDPLPDLRAVRDDVPASLLRAIEGALEKRVSRRWASVDEFLRVLDGDTSLLGAAGSDHGHSSDTGERSTMRFRRAEPTAPEPVVAAPSGAVHDAEPMVVPSGPVGRPALPRRRSGRRPQDASTTTDAFGTDAPPWEMPYPQEATPYVPPSRWPVYVRVVPVALLVFLITLGASALSERPASAALMGGMTIADAGSQIVQRDELHGALERVDTPQAPAETARSRADSLAACSRAANDAQRRCATALIANAESDVDVLFEELLELRRAAMAAGARLAPDSLHRMRVHHRAWRIERDVECAGRVPEREGSRWGRERSACLANITAARASELRQELIQAHRGR